MASITDFLNGFRGGTRVNRFRVSPSNCPQLGSGDLDIHIRATSFPEMDILPFPVNYQGKTVNIPNVRSYVPWVITVMDDVPPTGVGTTDVNSDLHKKFMNWSDSIVDTGEVFGVSRLGGAISTGGTIANGNQWTITHLDHVANTQTTAALKTFKLANCWPIQVGPIQLDMNQDQRIAMFNVTLAYTHLID